MARTGPSKVGEKPVTDGDALPSANAVAFGARKPIVRFKNRAPVLVPLFDGALCRANDVCEL